MDGKICLWVFEGFQKYEDPDETGPKPFFDSLKVYYPEKQMLMVADFTISQPRKEFAYTDPFHCLFIFHHNALNQPAFYCCSLLKSSPLCQKS